MVPTNANEASEALLTLLRNYVGSRHVLTEDRRTRRFRKGYSYGDGDVLAVVRPGTLLELWKVFKTCIETGRIVILQAANTGLNGGSTPYGDGYDREIVLISTMRIDRIDLLDRGRQVLCLPGATLHQLESRIRPLGREPHSIIGSTTIGASVVGGVCNNSGGALLRRGPAFTQLSLFARVNADRTVSLVNHLGIELGDEPEAILSRLDRGDYSDANVEHDPAKRASDPEYETLIKDIASPIPARYNHDPRLLREASGSSGRLCVFAVRLDTFPSAGPSSLFYIGTNTAAQLTDLRRHILKDFANLPAAGEYLNQDAYRLAEAFGKDLYLLIRYAGTARIPTAFGIKSGFDAITARLGLAGNLSDRLLQFLVNRLPNHLPARMNAFRDRYKHHLLLRMDGEGIEEARAYLKSIFPNDRGDFFECTPTEAEAALRHRYAIGGAAARYQAIHPERTAGMIGLDLALPRNTIEWDDILPAAVTDKIQFNNLCGHFFCQVFHTGYALKAGHNVHLVEREIIAHLDDLGIEFPSEHNVGHRYKAKAVLENFYRSLDPTNSVNPGIGRTSKKANWQ
ncbi:D-lactate dehydrogenase [Agrobacterium tumefaciens]|uniref:D-lactate dehydrogenase n=1 Tax=Agrobacterium tumefaciens TaxID=358 RepID=UPI002FDC5926